MENISDNIIFNFTPFTLSEDVSGPLIAISVAVETIFALIINFFIFTFTVCHPKILKTPSIIFLTNFVIINLLLAIVFMPSVVITAATGEWIFGETMEEKNTMCHIMGIIYLYAYYTITITLAIISVDRFLFIVKPRIHKRFMKTWFAGTMIIVLSIVFIGLSIVPLVNGSSTGKFDFAPHTGACLPQWPENPFYLTFVLIVLISSVLVIIVTTLWTFCFTKKFLKGLPSLSSSTASTSDNTSQNDVYNRRIKKVVGMFSMILVATIITYTPLVIFGITGTMIGFHRIPGDFGTITLIFFFSYTITNPVIQSYFRKELNDYIASKFAKFCSKPKLYCAKQHAAVI